MILLLWRRGGQPVALDQERKKQPAKDAPTDTRGPRVRCPLCAWVPRAGDRWSCACGCTWNTFDTRGRCPECSYVWNETQCLACHAWSRHAAWYVD